MNDDDLKRRLSALEMPAVTETARERARQRVLIAFRNSEKEVTSESRRGLVWWALAGCAALALVAAIPWPREELSDRTQNNAAVLAQVEALFPGQLDAVIQNGDDVRIELATVSGRFSDQPVIVEFRRSSSIIRVLSYSGRRVCIDLAGRPTCFEALVDNGGRVIVAGDDFISTAEDHAGTDGWKITAKALERAS